VIDTPPLPLLTRLWFAWLCFFRILFDGRFAARVWGAREEPALPPSSVPIPASALAPTPAVRSAPPPPVTRHTPTAFATPSAKQSASGAALQLLALLQREGRFVDFLEQDVGGFSDQEIGAAARVVHEGCRKALHAHAKIAPVRTEEEGASVTLEAGFKPSEIKLTGNVQGEAPYKGVLRHKGWRASELSLPATMEGHDPSILAPAEVEL
jgi:hypothetical protein